MAFGTQDDSDEVMNEINMTPMVDIMLVLLIIFIVTIPVMKHSVNIDLPRATNEAQNIKPETLRLSVDAQGAYFMNEARLQTPTLDPSSRPQQHKILNPNCTSAATRRCVMSVLPRPWRQPSKPVCAKLALSPNPKINSPTGYFLARLLTVDYRPMAAMPARAICASSLDLTPLTPTAPRHCPSFMMGTPPSSMPAIVGALKNEMRPPLITSS